MMKKFIYNGKYDGDSSKLPEREQHPAGAVAFREPEMEKFALIANAGGAVVIVALLACVLLRSGMDMLREHSLAVMIGLVLPTLTMFPHEYLHGLCFKETVYMYAALSKGVLFVVGPEEMTKTRFVIMSLCPNILFGLLPFLAGMIVPAWVGASICGALCLGMGFGDYINVFNALTQMPKGALTYLSGTHSYWYLPQ